MMFYYVQLWRHPTDRRPSIQERVQAESEGQAVILLMRHYHLKSVDRAWISPSIHEAPTVKLFDVVVKGGVRSWKQEIVVPSTQIPLPEDLARLRSKIQKVLALVSSPVPGEAAAACARAHDLLIRHGGYLGEAEKQDILAVLSSTR
jgi:hypothetical protein